MLAFFFSQKFTFLNRRFQNTNSGEKKVAQKLVLISPRIIIFTIFQQLIWRKYVYDRLIQSFV